MVNQTTIKVPTKYQERIREMYHDTDGYWVYLHKGWNAGDVGLHTIHEYTQKEVLQQLRDEAQPCECDYCKGISDEVY